MAKITQEKAEYVKSAKEDNCKDCIMFRKAGKCTLVEGNISPNGHCKFFKRKYRLPVNNDA